MPYWAGENYNSQQRHQNDKAIGLRMRQRKKFLNPSPDPKHNPFKMAANLYLPHPYKGGAFLAFACFCVDKKTLLFMYRRSQSAI
jgi:hypothetical protein